MPRTIAIVLEPDYSVRLEKLAFRTPVWIVDTPPNRAAAEEAWHTAIEWPHITVTMFRSSGPTTTIEAWDDLLDQIELHETPFDVVEVIGSPLTLPARGALMQHGFEKFDETESGFRAARVRR
jgi:hypothetical protein